MEKIKPNPVGIFQWLTCTHTILNLLDFPEERCIVYILRYNLQNSFQLFFQNLKSLTYFPNDMRLNSCLNMVKQTNNPVFNLFPTMSFNSSFHLFPLFILLHLLMSPSFLFSFATLHLSSYALLPPLYLQLSFIVRIVPSPDWFVGVDSVDLCDGDHWKDNVSLELFPYDAGTDSGFTFSSPNFETIPQDKITQVGKPGPSATFLKPKEL